MRFAEPLQPARLIRRYKRFLADATLPDGSEITLHCPNPGAMLGLAEPGMQIWLKTGRGKLKYGWVLTELPSGAMVGIDTTLPNRLVAEALTGNRIPELAGYGEIRPEVPYGENSRVDFRLSDASRPDCYLEVKNVHLSRQAGLAEFPDCVTARGAKHLRELAIQAQAGARAVMLFLVQRPDCREFRLAADCDPAYAAAFHKARKAGIEALCYACDVTLQGIALAEPLRISD
ncbi:DNA/RNA nuclease SfsA [Ferrovibrio sp.]|uniref:DNA/RNA nuclease SfsA n=1 Tax=Ferrovibrio sp. TaxID=1917215 RepID=UPI0035B4E784